jgi:hypothetical protein
MASYARPHFVPGVSLHGLDPPRWYRHQASKEHERESGGGRVESHIAERPVTHENQAERSSLRGHVNQPEENEVTSQSGDSLELPLATGNPSP